MLIIETKYAPNKAPLFNDNVREVVHACMLTNNLSGKTMTNNEIFKKLRIALDLKEGDLFQIFELGGYEINKSTLSAVFRRKGHSKYKPCPDEMLEAFLEGYIIFRRGKKEDSPT